MNQHELNPGAAGAMLEVLVLAFMLLQSTRFGLIVSIGSTIFPPAFAVDRTNPRVACGYENSSRRRHHDPADRAKRGREWAIFGCAARWRAASDAVAALLGPGHPHAFHVGEIGWSR